jgi:catechol 2,3-dioxygenase-like lactoylglutathione lyase family enzyme
MTIEINGMAHVILTVSRFEASREFYRRLLPEFGMKVVSDSDTFFYCVGARTAIGIEPCDPALAGERFVQQRVGLHHLCLRAHSRKDVDECAALLREMGATIVRGPAEDTWAPGYYSVLFEDPDGIRLEVNFVPGVVCSRRGRSFAPAHRIWAEKRGSCGQSPMIRAAGSLASLSPATTQVALRRPALAPSQRGYGFAERLAAGRPQC